MEFVHPVVDVIQSRKSIRNYRREFLKEEDRQFVQGCIQQLPHAPFGQESTFSWIVPENMDDLSTLPATYGVIRGATSYLVGTAKNEFQSLLDFGYRMEWIILHAWDRGVSSCWLGGTFQRGSVMRYLDLPAGHIVPAVTPLGYANENEGWMDGMMHTFMGSKRRKPWKEIFFHGSWDMPLESHPDQAVGQALEMVRLGPSAVNRQPWRLMVDEPWVHFFTDTRGITQMMYKGMFPLIDIGVACCHFELTMNGCGRKGKWLDSSLGRDRMRPGVQYCVSWRADE